MAVPATAQDALSAFLKNFPTPVHHIQPESLSRLWVFWSQDERSQFNSSSADLRPRTPNDNIKSAFSKLKYYGGKLLVQLWAPITIGGRRLLSTSGQPFSVNYLDNDLKKYRLRSMEYQYNIDEQFHTGDLAKEGYPMILSGGPAAAYLNFMPEQVLVRDHQGSPLARYALKFGLGASFMLPICSSQTSSCIGVVECTFSYIIEQTITKRMKNILEGLQEAGLRIFRAQERIPYKTLNGLEHARDDIQAALKIVCEEHNLPLAQVWISYKDNNHVPFSSCMEDTPTKCMVALKLTGYVNKGSTDFKNNVDIYYGTCDMVYLKAEEELVMKTLKDYKPRFCKNVCNLHHHILTGYASSMDIRSSGVAVCLRSIETGDLDYAFEFIWNCTSNNVVLLEAVLLTLKSCLPSFKFVSGAELGDELELHVIDDSDRGSETSRGIEREIFVVFKRKKSSKLPIILKAGKTPMVMDTSEAKWKMAPKQLPQELIEQQFGKTMKEAAKNLDVSVSTLKRKCKDFHIYEWQGPNVVKRKLNASCNDQSNRSEEQNGSIQGPSIVNSDESTLTIKAEYADDMMTFDLHNSQASFVNVQKEIGNKFNLTSGTYKLKYLDKDEDLILLTSDQDMSDCVKYFKDLGRPVVPLRVLPSRQKPSS